MGNRRQFEFIHWGIKSFENMRFAVHQTSRIGGRKYNQDRVAYAYTDSSFLLVLADGMGGHTHGEIAAQIAIHTFMQEFAKSAKPTISEPALFLRETMKGCHQAINNYTHINALEGSPGTTCVAALVQDGKVSWAHAGDSRLYLVREGKVVKVTRDHSVVQQLADWGIITKEEMKTHQDRNKITNCLGGVDDIFYVEASSSTDMQSGDVLLLCSDGFWSPLSNDEIAVGLAHGELSNSLAQLVDIALYREKERADNTTAIVARLGDVEEEHKTDMPVCMILD
jgi:serine/threonine protein phosphatase PrpC